MAEPRGSTSAIESLVSDAHPTRNAGQGLVVSGNLRCRDSGLRVSELPQLPTSSLKYPIHNT